MKKIFARIHLVLNFPHPFRLLGAYVLRKTGLSSLFLIYRDLYKLRFYPSALLMHYWADRSARESEVLFLGKLVKYGSIVIDVGANVGTLTLPLSRYVGENGKVFSIEANPRIYKYLLGNVSLNGFTNIETWNYALGDRSGEVDFSDISSDDMNHVLGKSTIDRVQKVPLTTLDKLLEDKKLQRRIRLLKIDVEGYEFFVLKGAFKTLALTDIVYFESWDNHFKRYEYDTPMVLKLLIDNFGFHVFRIEDGKLQKIDAGYRSEVCENLIAFKDLRDIKCLYEKD